MINCRSVYKKDAHNSVMFYEDFKSVLQNNDGLRSHKIGDHKFHEHL